jgi:hypothetical protein
LKWAKPCMTDDIEFRCNSPYAGGNGRARPLRTPRLTV